MRKTFTYWALPAGGGRWDWCRDSPTRVWWLNSWRHRPVPADYDDSGWDQDVDIQERLSKGLTFCWYRIKVTIPQEIRGESVEGRRVWFETNVDNYGEVYVDGRIDRRIGDITGNNVGKRVLVEYPANPGVSHTIAVLVGNGPLGEPVGTIHIRYATLAFE